ncbi:uncharacterized protein LOC133887342 [Phragmites australis]|uniref:uncharacterized protein LOC133887342 n=1 Tax=Phragmites australis TaxID=29695 RepID=UPI002D7948EF|nr:uncharacterized protein LOC133887342 [Phragmites australis]
MYINRTATSQRDQSSEMAGRLYKAKAKSFWLLVRRLLLRRSRKPPPAPAEEDGEESSGLLSRSSLKQLLVMDGAPGDATAVCRCAKKQGQAPVAVPLPAGLHRSVPARPEAATAVSSAGGGPDGAAVHRRFMFAGIRRRLLMRRPWRPMLVAIPE